MKPLNDDENAIERRNSLRLKNENSSKKTQGRTESKITLQTNDDWFFFALIQVYTSHIVVKQTESVSLQGFITPTYYWRKARVRGVRMSISQVWMK